MQDTQGVEGCSASRLWYNHSSSGTWGEGYWPSQEFEVGHFNWVEIYTLNTATDLKQRG